jgi:hypothetical protein
VIELGGEATHDLLHRGEVDHEPALGFETAFDEQADAIVVAVEFFAAMPGERNEVGGREDQIFLGDRASPYPA